MNNTEIIVENIVKLAKICDDYGSLELADKADKLLSRVAQVATAPYGMNPMPTNNPQMPTNQGQSDPNQIMQQIQTIIQAVGQLKTQNDQQNQTMQKQIQEIQQSLGNNNNSGGNNQSDNAQISTTETPYNSIDIGVNE